MHLHPSHAFTISENNDSLRRLTTQCDTCDTRQLDLPTIREAPRKCRYLSSTTYCVLTNLPDIWEVLWIGRYLNLVTSPEFEDVSNIREVSRKCQHLSFVIFLELVNLLNIREVLLLVLLSLISILYSFFYRFAEFRGSICNSHKHILNTQLDQDRKFQNDFCK